MRWPTMVADRGRAEVGHAMANHDAMANHGYGQSWPTGLTGPMAEG